MTMPVPEPSDIVPAGIPQIDSPESLSALFGIMPTGEGMMNVINGMMMCFPYVMSGECACETCETIRGAMSGVLSVIAGGAG